MAQLLRNISCKKQSRDVRTRFAFTGRMNRGLWGAVWEVFIVSVFLFNMELGTQSEKSQEKDIFFRAIGDLSYIVILVMRQGDPQQHCTVARRPEDL